MEFCVDIYNFKYQATFRIQKWKVDLASRITTTTKPVLRTCVCIHITTSLAVVSDEKRTHWPTEWPEIFVIYLTRHSSRSWSNRQYRCIILTSIWWAKNYCCATRSTTIFFCVITSLNKIMYVIKLFGLVRLCTNNFLVLNWFINNCVISY